MAQLSSRDQRIYNLICDYGTFEDAKVKQWVINQILKSILGPGEYERFVKLKEEEEGWDVGEAPNKLR